MNNEVSTDDAWLFLKRRSESDLSTAFLLRLEGGLIADREESSPGFAQRLRSVALATLDEDDPSWLHRALGALAFVGTVQDLDRINLLTCHGNEVVAKDATTCLFEIRRRFRET